MEQVRIYSPRDEAAVVAALPVLMQEAETLRAQDVAPTVVARRAITDTILSFVREHKRVVYGGYALNAAVCAVSPTDAFYSCDPEVAPPDIEFYSPDPVSDVCKLCLALHAAGHGYVQGKEAMHHGTFTVSVEFTRVCDVTYVPTDAYAHLPTVTDSNEGVEVIAPSFAMIDLLRVICDPFTSYWRLDKMFSRLCLLQRTFPLTVSTSALPSCTAEKWVAPLGAGIARTVLSARPTSCVAIGFAAYCSYFPEVAMATGYHSNVVSAVSANWKVDTADLEAELVAAFGRDRVEVFKHHPFMDIFGARHVYVVDENVVAVLYDAGHRAVPTCGRHDLDGLAIAAFPYVLMMALACAFHAQVEGVSDGVADRYNHMAGAMCALRSAQLEEYGLTVTDRNTHLRDFGGMQYVGCTLSPMRSHMLLIDERMKTRRGQEQAWFTFDPSKKRDEKGALPHRSFANVSGSLVVASDTTAKPARTRGGKIMRP